MSILRTAIVDTIHNDNFACVFQPIFRLRDVRCCGFEVLSRFPGEPYRSPDIWFADAEAVGLGLQLETAVIKKGLDALRRLPLDVYLSINISPAALASGSLEYLLDAHPHERIVLEVSEQVEVANFDALLEQVRLLQSRGGKLAVDDADGRYSGVQRTLRLRPDIIKMDMEVTSGIESNPANRSLMAAMVHFARETGAEINAKGIETEAEFNILRKLGVQRGQGWWLGRPVDLDAALNICRVGALSAAATASGFKCAAVKKHRRNWIGTG